MKQRYQKHGNFWRRTRIGSFIFNLKRNRLWLRRFACLWLFLIVFEIACPILECRDGGDFLADSSMNASVCHEANAAHDSSDAAFISNDNNPACNSISSLATVSHCGDECLCHVTGIPNIAFNLPNTRYRIPTSIVSLSEAPTLSLSPPYLPPKSA